MTSQTAIKEILLDQRGEAKAAGRKVRIVPACEWLLE